MVKKLLVFFIVIFMGSDVYGEAWIDNWIQQATISGPNSFEGQQRGYATAGSVSMRFRTPSNYLFNASLPSFNSGCGGIDIFAGGFNFLEGEYLEQQLEDIGTAWVATYVADLVMSVLSEPMQKSVKSLKALTDRLNQLQLNSCKASKGITAYVDSTRKGEDQAVAWQNFLMETGYDDFYYDTAQDLEEADGDAVNHMQNSDISSGCPSSIREVFFTPGSVLVNIARENGLVQEYALIMSALAGDIIVEDNNTGYHIIAPCPNSATNIDDFIYGDFEMRDSSLNCISFDGFTIDGHVYNGLIDWAEAMLREIIEAMIYKNALSNQNENFIQMMTSPVYSILLNNVKKMGTPDEAYAISQNLSYLCALTYAKAISKSLLLEIYSSIENLRQLAKTKRVRSDRCLQELLPVEMVDDLRSSLAEINKSFEIQYASALEEISLGVQTEALLNKEKEDHNKRAFQKTGIIHD